MQKSISNGSGHARTHTKLNTSILVADMCLGTRLRLCLGSGSRAGCLFGLPTRRLGSHSVVLPYSDAATSCREHVKMSGLRSTANVRSGADAPVGGVGEQGSSTPSIGLLRSGLTQRFGPG